MENVLIVLGGVIALAVIVLISYYNSLDRMRFHLDRLLQGAKPGLDAWVEAVEPLRPDRGEAWRGAKRNWERTACLQELIETPGPRSAEALSLQEDLLEFCHRYNDMAERYNKRLDGPLGPLAARLGFRPYAILDFYPDVRPLEP